MDLPAPFDRTLIQSLVLTDGWRSRTTKLECLVGKDAGNLTSTTKIEREKMVQFKNTLHIDQGRGMIIPHREQGVIYTIPQMQLHNITGRSLLRGPQVTVHPLLHPSTQSLEHSRISRLCFHWWELLLSLLFQLFPSFLQLPRLRQQISPPIVTRGPPKRCGTLQGIMKTSKETGGLLMHAKRAIRKKMK